MLGEGGAEASFAQHVYVVCQFPQHCDRSVVPALLMGLGLRELILKIMREMEFHEKTRHGQTSAPTSGLFRHDQLLLSPHPPFPTHISPQTTLLLPFPHL